MPYRLDLMDRLAHRRAVLVLIAWLGLTGIAGAHASLNRTEPIDGAVVAAPPSAFTLTFSEPVSPLSLSLIGPDGAATALDAFSVASGTVEIAAPEGLGEGTHVLSWRVVSADGHPVGGSLIFSIGAPSAAPPPLVDPVDPLVRSGLLVTKLGLYIGLFVGIGGAFAIALLLPASRAGAGIVRSAIVLGGLSAVASVGFQGLDALGVGVVRYFDPMVWTTALGTSYGRTVVVMIAAAVVSGLSLVPEFNASRGLTATLALIGVVGGATALAASGHASSASPQWLMRPAVFVHAATIAVWIGALAPLGLALRGQTVDAPAALTRFSMLIPFAVAMLATAGVALAVVQVEQPSALVETAYGRLLCAKLALLAVLFLIVARNRWRLTAPVLAGAERERRSLTRSIAVETAIVLVIFAIAAGWRFTPPPRALAIAAAQPAELHIHTNEAMADLTVAPGRAGSVSVSAILMTGEFGPLDAKEVSFVFSNPGAGIEPFARDARKPGDGTWRSDDVILPLAGRWTVGIEILVTDFDLTRIEGEIDIRP